MRNGFWNQIDAFGESIALITETGSVTYSELAELSDKIAETIPTRSLVFLVCRNHLPCVAGYIGFLRKGIVPVLVSHLIDKELFENLVRLYKPGYIFCPDDFTNEPGIFSYDGYKTIMTDFAAPELYDELALMITTSGSTGSPKFVRLSYSNLQSNTESIVSYLNISSDDRAITTMPMSYVFGLSIVQTHLSVGACVILSENNILNPAFGEAFKKHEATTLGEVPYIYRILDKLSFLKLNLPSLRYVTQAGGRLDSELQQKIASGFNKKGIAFYSMYGASEATARMSYLPAELAVSKAGSIGIPVPGGRFELVAKDGTLITEPNTVGELVYYGKNVMLGHANTREDLALGDMLHGRLMTGDLAKKDADGCYYIVGRKNRFLKIYGNRISLDETENLLSGKGYEAACVGYDDHMQIYTTSSDDLAILKLLAEKTGLGIQAFTVIHIDKLPRNETGKLLYNQLESPAQD